MFSTFQHIINTFSLSFSGLSSPDHSRGVTPVYLRCSAGRISWLYPRGALRVILRLPAHDREFRACIRIHPNVLPSSLSRRKSSFTKNFIFPARLFLEGPRSLHSLYSEEDSGRGNTVRCFQSKKGQAAIYVEAIEGDEMLRRVAEFEYDLEPLPRGKGYDPVEGRIVKIIMFHFWNQILNNIKFREYVT